MTSRKILEIFNIQLMKFLTEICKMYPDNRKFISLKGQIRSSLLIDNKLSIRIFYKYIVKDYKEQVLKKDDDFFLNFDVSGSAFESLNYIKTIWRDSDENTKNAIYKFILLLTRLCSKYYS